MFSANWLLWNINYFVFQGCFILLKLIPDEGNFADNYIIKHLDNFQISFVSDNRKCVNTLTWDHFRVLLLFHVLIYYLASCVVLFFFIARSIVIRPLVKRRKGDI